MVEPTWTRRGAALALATLAPAACAAPPRRPLVSINFAASDRPRVRDEDGAVLESALDKARRMAVPVFIDERGPFEFVVDTGANRSVVAADLAAELGLRPAGAVAVHSIAGVESTAQVEVASLRVDRVVSRGLHLPVMPRDRMGAAGLLGVDMLTGRRVGMNFKANRFDIAASGRRKAFAPATDSNLKQLEPPVVVPARYRAGQLVILDADIAGARVAAFLDSGSQITVGNLALRDAVLKKRPQLADRFYRTPLISATGQTIDSELAVLPLLRLGGLGVTNLLIAFAPLHVFALWDMVARPSMLVGVDVMRQFEDIVLDFGRREVLFWPPRYA